MPARLAGYGEHWDGDRCTLWCEGLVQQSAVFGEDLHLRRRIEAEVGTDEIRVVDRVVNHGFYETPHMLLYHLNVGYPVLDEGARFLAPVADVVMASHAGEGYRRQGVGYRTMPGPRDGFSEQVWEHDLARERGELAILKHGEERRYDLTLRVLDGAGAIAEAERRIRAVGGQPQEDFPEPSGTFAPLR